MVTSSPSPFLVRCVLPGSSLPASFVETANYRNSETSPSALSSHPELHKLTLPFQLTSLTAKDVSVLKEVHVRSCIVLPSKVLSKNAASEVLL